MATQLATTNDHQNALAQSPEAARFGLMQRQARMFASSPLVPDHLRKGTPEQSLANCYIALTLAEAMGEVPLIVMQNIHVVHGVAGFKTEYKIARANRSGIFSGRIDWRVDRSDQNNLRVTAFAHLKDTGEEVSFTCDMKMAEAEGWTSNKKYRTMPEVMLRYRSASFLIRFYAGDVMLGYQTVDEIEDVYAGQNEPAAGALTGAMLITQANDDGKVMDVEATPVEEAASANDGALSDDNPTAREGRADSQMGDQHDGTDDAPPYAALVNRLMGGIGSAKNATYLKAMEEEFLGHSAGLPDEVAREIDAAITAKRKALAA